MRIEGKVELVIVRDGQVVFSQYDSNIVVMAGKNLAAAIIQTGGTRPSHFAFGSGGNAPDESQTALQTEFTTGTMPGYARHAFVSSLLGNVVTYATAAGGFIAGGAGSLREIGIFNASVAGTLFSRFLTSAFTLKTGDVISLSWSVTVG